MIDFDPFGKPLREVEMDDLDRLAERNISEGVYMEYKRSLPSTQSLAKVIGSFANTHGGYFLIGVAEEEITNIASGQIGVNIEENPDPKETVRNVVRDHLNPSPNFVTRVIQRDDYENYVLLLIEVPESRNTPHLHSSGQIHTRTGEGSDPIEATTDRWEVDKLYERRDEWENQVDQFCQLDLMFTKGQEGTLDNPSDGWPFVEIYAIPSTFGEPLCTEVLEDLDLFKSTLAESEVYLPDIDDIDDSFCITAGEEYSTYRASNDAVVAQHFNRDGSGEVDPGKTPESVKFYQDGGLRALQNVPQIYPSADFGESWRLFAREVDSNVDSIRFLDGKGLIMSVHTLLNSYLRLLEECGWMDQSGRKLHFRARTRNGYRTALLFDESWYSQLITEYGAPISYEGSVTIPHSGTQLFYPSNENEFWSIARFTSQLLEGFGLAWQEASRSSEFVWETMWDMVESDHTAGT